MLAIPEQNSVIGNIECGKIISNFIKESFDLVNFEIKKFSDEVLGFLAEHFSLVVTYKTRKSSQTYTAQFFVKALPVSNGSLSDYVTNTGIFDKELALYSDLIPTLLKISRKAFAPKCYFIDEKFLVLEDLKINSYKIEDSSYLSVNKMVGLLKAAASFHASSIIFEEQRSTPEKKYRLIDHYREELKETTFSFVEGEPRQKWCVTCIKCISDCMKLQSKYKIREERHEKLKHVILERMQEYIKPSKIFRNVINHDDLWSNNVMFNDLDEAIMVDFQLARYVPPAYDVLMALYLNTRREFLVHNFKYLLDIYYQSLAKELSIHNIDIKNICSKKEFDKSVEVYRLPALIESVMYGTIIYISQELSDHIITNLETFNDFQLVNRSKYVTKEYLENSDFRNRFDEVLYPLIELLDEIEIDSSIH